MGTQVIEQHNLARAQAWSQNVFNVLSKTGPVTPPSIILLGPIPPLLNELMVVVFGGVLRGNEATARSPRGLRA